MELNRITSYTESFNAIAQHIEGENGEKVEVWFARDLQSRLGYARIRSKGDTVLFGGFTTEDMKRRLGVKSSRPLADFLPTLTIAAKNLATEMTNYNVEQKDLYGEASIATEHMDNNRSVRQMLSQRGIKPEELPPSEDIKKIERRVTSNEKKIEKTSSKLPPRNND